MPNRTYHPRGVKVDGYAPRDHPLYNTWANMLSRCYDEKQPGYVNYGGRGIKVCERWHHFANFAADMGPKPHPKLTIERKNNNGDYEPKNCVWATRTAQCLNRRKFKNNSTGFVGVELHKPSGRFIASYQVAHEMFLVGRFDTAEEAAEAREKFIKLFNRNPQKARASISGERLWCTSSTGRRGVTVAGDGYVARCTINGKRHYVGHFSDPDQAYEARTRFIEERTGGA